MRGAMPTRTIEYRPRRGFEQSENIQHIDGIEQITIS